MSNALRGLFLASAACASLLASGPVLAEPEAYAPAINPTEFTTEISNPYFRLSVGRRMFYQQDSEDGRETTETWVTGEKRTINGVETLVSFDRVYLNGELIEETKDYVAQHRTTGDVWYFGEDVDNYEDGRFLDHNGAWIYGQDGALPGIWFKASPQVGDTYRQEYYRGQAEDMARVDALGQAVRAGGRDYHDCVRTYEWTPLEVDSGENKYYCRDVGATVAEVELESGARDELIRIQEPN